MNDVLIDAASRPLAAGLIRPGTPLRSQAWLSELERARWEAQPRYEGAPDMPVTQVANEKANSAEADRFGVLRPFDQPETTPRSSRIADLALPALDLFVESDTHFANKKVMHVPAMETPEIVGAPVRNSNSVDRSRPQTETVATLTQSFGTRWSSRSIHTHVGEQATAVWIRDAGLSPQQAVRLLERLRPLLSGDRATSAGVIQLTVNGRAVLPGGHR